MELQEMNVLSVDVRRSEEWAGPIATDWETLKLVQRALDRFQLDVVIGNTENSDIYKYVKIVSKPEEVDSSMMNDVSYDEPSEKMTVTFKSGTRYEYSDVEKPIYLGLKEAKSKGKFFQRHVRSLYPYKKID